MAKVNYRYKYKPSATKLFSPAKKKDTRSYIEGQIKGLETRFGNVGVDTTQPKEELDKRNILEKALNLKPKQDVVMDILEVLDRPREVVANVLSSLGDSDQRNILEAAWEGLSGQKRLSTREALQNLTGDEDFLQIKESDGYWDEIGNIVVDVALDIAADPTTYLGFGMFTKPLKAAGKQVGKLAGKVGETVLDIARKSEKLKPAVEATEAFVKNSKKWLDDIGYAFNATKGLTNKDIRAIKKISAEAGETADTLKLAIDDVAKILRKSGIKDADKLAAELIETGAELSFDAATKTWKATTKEGVLVWDDLLKQFYGNVKSARKVATGTIMEKIIPVNLNKLPAEIMQNVRSTVYRVVGRLNKIAGKKLFKLRVVNGSVAMQFLGTADEFAAVLKQSDEILKLQTNFGKRILSQEALEAVAKNGELMKDATDKLRNVQDLTRKFLQQMGEFDVGGKYFASNVEYLRRVPTAQADEFFKGQKYVVTDYVRPGTSDLASRTYEGTTKEINEALKNLYGAKDNLFNESALLSIQDLVNVAQKRYNQTNLLKMFLGVEYDSATKTYKKLENAPQFFFATKGKSAKEVAEQLPSGYKVLKGGNLQTEFSNLWKNLPDEMKKALDDDLLQTVGAASQDGVVAMQQSAYNIFKNIDNAYTEVPKLIQYYDKSLGLWKGVTLLSPGFHVRNLFGNATNMYLSGMNTFDIIKYQSKAIKDYLRWDKLRKVRAELGEQALKQSDRIFLNNFDEIAKSGVLTGHRGARDLEDVKSMIERLGQGKELQKKGLLQSVVSTNFNLSESIDDIQRMALYQWALKKTGNSADAFRIVRESLFDYTLLTPFERNVMKRAIPFYTFMKNNLVFQAKNITKNTQQYAKLLRSYKHWTEGMTDMDVDELPDYMQNNMWLPIPTLVNRDDKDTINFLKLNLPPADFAELVRDPFNKGVTSLTVPVKLALELGTGRDSFTGAPLREFPGQVNRMEPGTGTLSGLRDQSGEFFLMGDPVIQKIADDLGLRNPRKLVTAMLDIADLTTGKQSFGSFMDDLAKVGGITAAKSLSEIELTTLYQKLEELRNLKKLYEQQTGGKLPTQKEFENRFGYRYKK